ATVDTVSFPAGHGMKQGETVYISKANPAAYNGYFTITAVPSPTTFQYALPYNPGAISNSGYFGRLTTGGKMIQENNLIESAPPQTDSSLGMRTGTTLTNPPILFPQVLLRRNVIRATDGMPDPPSPYGYTRVGLQVLSGGGLIIEENVID